MAVHSNRITIDELQPISDQLDAILLLMETMTEEEVQDLWDAINVTP